MPKFFQGSGALGRDVAYSELDSTTQKSTPQVLANQISQLSVVGNGADQTVFSDTLTITPGPGDVVVVYMKLHFTRTAGAGIVTAYTPKLGATNMVSQGANDGNSRVIECRSAGGGTDRGYFIVREIQDGATGTAADNIVTNATTYTLLPTTVSLTVNIPAASTYMVNYSYCVILFKTGV